MPCAFTCPHPAQTTVHYLDMGEHPATIDTCLAHATYVRQNFTPERTSTW